MKPMILLLDMDGIVANLLKKWLNTYNQEYDDNLTLTQIGSWDVEKYAKKCSPKEFHAIIERPHFFADLEVLPGSIEITKKLQDMGHILYFVTATPYDNPTAAYDKQKWVDKYFPHMGKSKIIHTHDKYMVLGSLLLDDHPKNLEEFPGIKVVVDYPYNQDVKADYRVKDWFEFLEVIKKIGLDKK